MGLENKWKLWYITMLCWSGVPLKGLYPVTQCSLVTSREIVPFSTLRSPLCCLTLWEAVFWAQNPPFQDTCLYTKSCITLYTYYKAVIHLSNPSGCLAFTLWYMIKKFTNDLKITSIIKIICGVSKSIGLCSNQVVSIFVAKIYFPVTIYPPILTCTSFCVIQVAAFFNIHYFKEYWCEMCSHCIPVKGQLQVWEVRPSEQLVLQFPV